jgi:hypothetical protein
MESVASRDDSDDSFSYAASNSSVSEHNYRYEDSYTYHQDDRYEDSYSYKQITEKPAPKKNNLLHAVHKHNIREQSKSPIERRVLQNRTNTIASTPHTPYGKARPPDPDTYSSPRLNEKTLQILNSIQRKQPTPKGHLENKENERHALEGELFASLNSPNRKITPRAAALIREGSVSDKLYEQSFLLNDKKRQLNEKYLQDLKQEIQREVESPIRPNHAQQQFTTPPVRNRKQNIFNLLEKPQHQPVINSVSDEIASRLPQTPMERLLQGHIPSNTKTNYKGNDDMSIYSFRPYINPKSKEIEEQRFGVGDFKDRVNHWENQERRKKEKIKMARQEIEEKELEGCTFSPVVSPMMRRREPTKSFDDRNKQWERKKQIKLTRERAAVARNELAECSFRPSKSRSSSPNISRSDSPVKEMAGFDEFIARHKSARDRKKEEPVPGSNWKPQLTKPVGPQLGKRTRDKIKALDRPVGYPIPFTPPKSSKSPQLIRNNVRTSRSSSPVTNNRGGYAAQARGKMLHPAPLPKLVVYEDEDEDEDEDEKEEGFNPEHFPRQGLFSSRSTVNILEELKHNFVKNMPAEDTRPSHTREETEQEDARIYNEWALRSKQKDS